MMAKKRPRNPDHVRRRQQPQADVSAISEHLQTLLSPLVYAQQSYYRSLGLRARILTLPLMVAAVLTLIWRQVPSVHELTRLLERENLLWCAAVKVSQQALSERFLTFPATIFERVFQDLLPLLEQRWQGRSQRPIPVSVTFAFRHFERIWAADGSTLEALFRKLDSLAEVPVGQLAGKICTVIDLVTQLPVQIWWQTQPLAHDTNFCQNLLDLATAKTLLILDRGFYDFQFFLNLKAQSTDFITRIKSNAAYQVEQVLTQTFSIRDCLVSFKTSHPDQPLLHLRLVEVRQGQVWYGYLTSVLDPGVLPPAVVADLYRRRWRVEEAFCTVKRLLGLSYLWTGSLNGVKLQVWATWLFYAVLVDLADAVADELLLPFDRISLEMLFRGLYHFNHASAQGKATNPITYFAAPENKNLGIVKVLRKPPHSLDLSPFPNPLTPGTFA
jgi:Transposase DDE domain